MKRSLGRVLALFFVVMTGLLSVGCETTVGVGVGVAYPYGGYGPGMWGPGPIYGGPVWR